MIGSSMFSFGGTHDLNPKYLRQCLNIPEDQLKILNSLPEWSKEESDANKDRLIKGTESTILSSQASQLKSGVTLVKHHENVEIFHKFLKTHSFSYKESNFDRKRHKSDSSSVYFKLDPGSSHKDPLVRTHSDSNLSINLLIERTKASGDLFPDSLKNSEIFSQQKSDLSLSCDRAKNSEGMEVPANADYAAENHKSIPAFAHISNAKVDNPQVSINVTNTVESHNFLPAFSSISNSQVDQTHTSANATKAIGEHNFVQSCISISNTQVNGALVSTSLENPNFSPAFSTKTISQVDGTPGVSANTNKMFENPNFVPAFTSIAKAQTNESQVSANAAKDSNCVPPFVHVSGTQVGDTQVFADSNSKLENPNFAPALTHISKESSFSDESSKQMEIDAEQATTCTNVLLKQAEITSETQNVVESCEVFSQTSEKQSLKDFPVSVSEKTESVKNSGEDINVKIAAAAKIDNPVQGKRKSDIKRSSKRRKSSEKKGHGSRSLKNAANISYSKEEIEIMFELLKQWL